MIRKRKKWENSLAYVTHICASSCFSFLTSYMQRMWPCLAIIWQCRLNKSLNLYSTSQVENRAINWSARSGGIPFTYLVENFAPPGYYHMAYTGMHRWRDHLWQKKNPFRMPSINNWCLFHIYPVSNFSSPLNCCKCIVFKTWINHKTRTYCRLFHNNKIYLLAIWAFLQTEKTDFPTLLLTSTGEIPTLSYTWSLKKVPPGTSLYGLYGDVPLPTG